MDAAADHPNPAPFRSPRYPVRSHGRSRIYDNQTPRSLRSLSRITRGTGPTRTLFVPATSSRVLLAPGSWQVPVRRQSHPAAPQIPVPDHAADQPNPAPFWSPRYPVRSSSRRSHRRSRFDDHRTRRSRGSLSRTTRRISPTWTLFRTPVSPSRSPRPRPSRRSRLALIHPHSPSMTDLVPSRQHVPRDSPNAR